MAVSRKWMLRVALGVVLFAVAVGVIFMWPSTELSPSTPRPMGRRVAPPPPPGARFSTPTTSPTSINWEDYYNPDGSPKFSDDWKEFQAWAHSPERWEWSHGAWHLEKTIKYPLQSTPVFTTMEPEERAAAFKEAARWRYEPTLSPDQQAQLDEMKRLYLAGDFDGGMRIGRELHKAMRLIVPDEEDSKPVKWIERQEEFARAAGEEAAYWREKGVPPPRPYPERNEVNELLANVSTDDIVAMLADPAPTVNGIQIPPHAIYDYLRSLSGAIKSPSRLVLSEKSLAKVMEVIRNPPSTTLKNREGQLLQQPDSFDLLMFTRSREAVPFLLDLLRGQDATDASVEDRTAKAARALERIHDRDPLTPEQVTAVRSAWEAIKDTPQPTPDRRGGDRWSMIGSLSAILKNALPVEENPYFVNIATSPSEPAVARIAVMDRLRGFDAGERALLMQIASSDPNGEVRAAAVSVLSSEESSRPTPELEAFLRRELLSSSAPEVRINLASHYYSADERKLPPEVLADLRRLAESDPEPRVREHVADVLRQIHEGTEARKRLEEFLDAEEAAKSKEMDEGE